MSEIIKIDWKALFGIFPRWVWKTIIIGLIIIGIILGITLGIAVCIQGEEIFHGIRYLIYGPEGAK